MRLVEEAIERLAVPSNADREHGAEAGRDVREAAERDAGQHAPLDAADRCAGDPGGPREVLLSEVAAETQCSKRSTQSQPACPIHVDIVTNRS